MKKTFAIAMLIAVCGLAALPCFTEEILNANDLKTGAFTSSMTADAFIITASSEKNASVDPLDVARTAKDDSIFNARIKLGGAGTADYRSIVFSVNGKADITVYLASSSKTDARVCNLVNAADGTIVAEIPAPADDGVTAFIGTATIPAAGKYFLASKSGGIYVFGVTVK